MCGIVGYSKRTIDSNQDYLRHGVRLLNHRGPDDFGEYENHNKSIGLAHTRLSILDLSSHGHQPMSGITEGYILVYNGEIYNFIEIKNELEKFYDFRGHSDSEVVLYAYIHYGVEFLKKLNGIFSLAIYDKENNELLIARDRFGTKPLYYTHTQSGFYFASELKVLMTLDDLPLDIDYAGIENYMTYLWSPSPYTPLKSIKKLEAGNYLILQNAQLLKEGSFHQASYSEEDNRSLEELIEITDSKLKNAITSQVVSDVPIGAFLSGGLDSSAVVSYMKNYTDDKIQTFTIKAANDLGMADDYHYANKVADYLGVDVHPVEISHDMFFDIENMIYYLDEPQADLAPILVSYISKIAKEEYGIKVLLSGAGGDDIFSGYRRHYAIGLDNYMRYIPKSLRHSFKKSLTRLPSNSSFLRRLKKYTKYFDLDGDEKIVSYFNWISKEKRRTLFSKRVQGLLEQNSYETSSVMIDYLDNLSEDTSELNKMLSLDNRFFLTDHNLNYTDKMGMKEGVEIRVPLLDNDLVDFASTIPSKYKQYGKEGKYIFKKTMEKYLPKDVIYRPKTGFGTPLKSWIHGELKEYINTILSEDAIKERGIFDYNNLQQMILADKLGHEDYSYNILSMLSIELWFKIFIDNREQFKKANNSR